MDNKMATMPVNKLMIKMGLPVIISMMLQALYNNGLFVLLTHPLPIRYRLWANRLTTFFHDPIYQKRLILPIRDQMFFFAQKHVTNAEGKSHPSE